MASDADLDHAAKTDMNLDCKQKDDSTEADFAEMECINPQLGCDIPTKLEVR